MEEVAIQALKPVATLAIEWMRFVLPLAQYAGISSRTAEEILSKDIFAEYEYNKTHPQKKLADGHPTVGVIIFKDLDPSLARIIYGVLAPIWFGFAFLSVYFPKWSLDFKGIQGLPSLIMFYGSAGGWGLAFLCFGLSFIPSAAMRFIYFLAFIISSVVGPWLGYWVIIAVYSMFYLLDIKQ